MLADSELPPCMDIGGLDVLGIVGDRDEDRNEAPRDATEDDIEFIRGEPPVESETSFGFPPPPNSGDVPTLPGPLNRGEAGGENWGGGMGSGVAGFPPPLAALANDIGKGADMATGLVGFGPTGLGALMCVCAVLNEEFVFAEMIEESSVCCCVCAVCCCCEGCVCCCCCCCCCCCRCCC